jgi:nucleoside-diphosphate-sugar epimerase
MTSATPLILITGATGVLGGRVLRWLVHECGCSSPIVATYHSGPPVEPVSPAITWVPFELATPAVLVQALSFPNRVLVLHFACSLSGDVGRIFRLDCLGTEKLATLISRRCSSCTFVFASSVAAAAITNYGIGKAWVENRLQGLATDQFTPVSVRIPVVGPATSPLAELSLDGFCGWFARAVVARCRAAGAVAPQSWVGWASQTLTG